MFSLATVKEKNNIIVVKYINNKAVQADISRIFKTTIINKFIFKESGCCSFSVYSFFALELYHAITLILKDPVKTHTSRKTLKAINKGLIKNTWLSNIHIEHPDKLDFTQLNKFHFPPLTYQYKFIEKYNENVPRYNIKGMLLNTIPGAGKAFISLAIAECLLSDYIVIITPELLFENEWISNISYSPIIGGIYKTPQTYFSMSNGKPYMGERIIVIQYDLLPNSFEIMRRFKSKKVTIILDESHNLNKDKSLRTLGFFDFCYIVKDTDIIFTTTKFENILTIESLYLFKVIDPLFNDKILQSLKKMHLSAPDATSQLLSRRFNAIGYRINEKTINLKKPIIVDIKFMIDNCNDYTLSKVADEMILFCNNRITELVRELPRAKKFFYKKLNECKKKILSNKTMVNIIDHVKYEECLNTIINTYNTQALSNVLDEIRYCRNYEKNVLLPLLSADDVNRFIECKSIVKYLKVKVARECLTKVLNDKKQRAIEQIVNNFDFVSYIEASQKKTLILTTDSYIVDSISKILKNKYYLPLIIKNISDNNFIDIIDNFNKKQGYNPLVCTYGSLITDIPLSVVDTIITIDIPDDIKILEHSLNCVNRTENTSKIKIFRLTLDTGNEPNICSLTIDIRHWFKTQLNGILLNDTDSAFE